MKRLLLYILLFLLIVLSYTTSYCQQKTKSAADRNTTILLAPHSGLYKEIYRQDSIFFDAFNSCDTIAYRDYLTSNFEFYHDLGGLHYLEEEMQSMREMCARNSHIRRQLLTKTLEVSKLGDNGALEIGVHRFYHTNAGQTEHLSGEYRFINVWQKKDGAWKLSRVISYDHQQMNNN